jgi:hypothetical protein
MEHLLRRLREEFLPDYKAFQQQRRLLQIAIAHPAHYLKIRGVTIPARRLIEIHETIITGIRRHGDLAKIKFFGAYYLAIVQAHMRHQGERYYNEGKAARNAVERAMDALRARPVQDDAACHQLAELHDLLKAGAPKKPRRKPACKPTAPVVPDLFESQKKGSNRCETGGFTPQKDQTATSRRR